MAKISALGRANAIERHPTRKPTMQEMADKAALDVGLVDPSAEGNVAPNAVPNAAPAPIEYGPGTAEGDAARNALSAYGAGPSKGPSQADIQAGMAYGAAHTPTDYNSLFMQSLAKSRSAIQAQIQGALAEINRQQGIADQEVNTMPGTYDALNAGNLKMLTDTANSAQAAQDKTGLGSFTPAGTIEQPMANASNMATGFLKSGVPLLHLGVQDASQARRGQLTQAGLEANAQLDAQQRDFLASQAQAQQSGNTPEARLAEENRQFAHDREMANLGVRNQASLAELNHRQSVLDNETQSLQAGGVPLTGEQAMNFRQSPLYTDLVGWMQKNPTKDSSEWLKEHGYGGDLAGPGLEQFLNKLKALAEYDLMPKNGSGTVVKPPTTFGP